MTASVIEVGSVFPLDKLKKGCRAKVLSVACENEALRRRMFDMGIVSGVEIFIKKTAPFGDPVSIELRGYELCLRKAELRNIQAEVV